MVGVMLLILVVPILLFEILAVCVLAIMDFYTPNFIWPTLDYLNMNLVGPVTLIIGIVGGLFGRSIRNDKVL
jgi:hypothetical protein